MNEVLIQTKSKEYPLIIGSKLFTKDDILQRVINQKTSSILIITDDIVASLYLNQLVVALSPFAPVHTKIIPNGEESKSIDMYYECQSFALENNLDRHSLIVALGGGVVGDLAGFVASTFMRGIAFIQVPTTLLAHDSAVGGKVAINHPLGKNVIGAFYQPDAVLYDTSFLSSLPQHEQRAGFAELIKHSLIWDREFYPWLRKHVPTLQHLHGHVLEEGLLRGINIKAIVVKEDEKETGIRSFLNFGHTLAHALEAELGYGKISHGDAVAIGMIFAMKVSEKMLHVTLPIQQLQEWFDSLGYPSFPKSISPDSLLQRMKKDKKAVKGTIRMNLMEQVGTLTIEEVEDRLLLEILQQECEEVI